MTKNAILHKSPLVHFQQLGNRIRKSVYFTILPSYFNAPEVHLDISCVFTYRRSTSSNVAMEAANLYTAATYVNNLLLARGLLRNGKSVEFAQLASLVPKEKRKEAEGNAFSATNTVADIINLVHDLILKRDVSSKRRLQLRSLLIPPSAIKNIKSLSHTPCAHSEQMLRETHRK